MIKLFTFYKESPFRNLSFYYYPIELLDDQFDGCITLMYDADEGYWKMDSVSAEEVDWPENQIISSDLVPEKEELVKYIFESYAKERMRL